MIQEITELLVDTFAANVRLHLKPTTVHGKVVVFNVVATLLVVAVCDTNISSFAVGRRLPLTIGTLGLKRLKVRLDITRGSVGELF